MCQAWVERASWSLAQARGVLQLLEGGCEVGASGCVLAQPLRSTGGLGKSQPSSEPQFLRS